MFSEESYGNTNNINSKLHHSAFYVSNAVESTFSALIQHTGQGIDHYYSCFLNKGSGSERD
jgi:hypothetical protein